jgi:hypothetical protein
VSDDFELFTSVLQSLEEVGILSSVVIIGGWAQILYRQYFKDPPELSVLRTRDIDILFARPLIIKPVGNLEEALAARGFDRIYGEDGTTKFSTPEAEIEFLVPERGRGDEKPYLIKELAIRASSLRLVDMLMVDPLEVRYGKYKIKIPDPIRFCFNKLLVSQRRKKKEKREKDLGTAFEIAALLSRFPKWRKLLSVRLEELPKKQRALVLSLLKQNDSPAVAAATTAAMGVAGVGHVGAMRTGLTPGGPWPRPREPDGPLGGPVGGPTGRGGHRI